MKYAIIALMLPALLTACAKDRFSPLAIPDVVTYPQPVMDKAANEIDSGTCPVLSDVMMPDYSVMRDQARAAK